MTICPGKLDRRPGEGRAEAMRRVVAEKVEAFLRERESGR